MKTKNKLGKSIFILLIFILTCGFASASSIDWEIEPNLNQEDFVVENDLIAVDSSKYTFEKIKIKDVYELQCTKTSSYENGTDYCSKFENVKVGEDYKLATIEFSGCNEGKTYRIYKHDDFVKDKEKIKNEGYVFGYYTCKENKITFDIDSFSSYTQEEIDDLTDSNVVYYSLDDTDLTGSNPNDLSINGNDATNNGATTGATGLLNEGFSFDGSNDYLVPSDKTDFNFDYNTAFTLSLWFKADSFNTYYSLFNKQNPASPFNGYSLTKWNDNKIKFQLMSSVSNYDEVVTTTAYTDTTNFHHIVGVWEADGTIPLIYYDGVPASTTTVSEDLDTSSMSNALDLYIGQTQNSDQNVDGTLDEIAVFDRALTSDEIALLYDLNKNEQENIYSYTPPVAGVTYTSQKHIPINVVDSTGVTISGEDFILLENFSFNLLRDEDVIIKGFGYSSATLPEENTLYIKINDGTVIFNDSVSIMPAGNGGFRQWNIKPVLYSGVTGNNSIEVWGREEGNGVVNVFNFDLFLDTEETENGILVNSLESETNSTSSTTAERLLGFSLVKEQTSPTWVESSFKFTNNEATPTTVECIYKDNTGTIDLSDRLLRYIDSNGIGSLGLSNYLNINSTQIDFNLYCNNSAGVNVSIENGIYYFNAEDSEDEVVDGTNSEVDNTGLFSSGEHLLSEWNYSVKQGEGATSQFGIIFSSTSGSQDGVDTPIFFINSSTGCYKEYKRSVDASNQYGAIKGGLGCKQTLDTNVTYTLFVDVAVGETINIFDTSASSYETQDINVTQQPVPIVNTITAPANGTVQTSSVGLVQEVIDIDGRGFTSEIILFTDEYVQVAVLKNETLKLNTTSYDVSLTGYPLGDYVIRWIVDDGVFTSSSDVSFEFKEFDLIGQWEYNVCPDDTPSAIVFIGFLFAILVAIGMCYKFKWYILGAVTGFFVAMFGWYFVGCWVIGSIFLLVFGFMVALLFMGEELRSKRMD